MTLFDDIQNEIDAGIEDIGFPTEGYYHIMTASEMIDKLREEYAPTVKMTREQYRGLLFEGKGRETAHKNFVFLHEIQKLNDAYISINILMNAFAHPETIKIVDE